MSKSWEKRINVNKLPLLKQNIFTLPKISTNAIDSAKPQTKTYSIIKQLNNDQMHNIETKPNQLYTHQVCNQIESNSHLYTNTLEAVEEQELNSQQQVDSIINLESNNMLQTNYKHNQQTQQFSPNSQLKNIDSIFIDSAIGSPLWSPHDTSADAGNNILLSNTISTVTSVLPTTSKKFNLLPDLIKNVCFKDQ